MPIKLKIKRKTKSKCTACSPCAGMQEAKLKKIPKSKSRMERFVEMYEAFRAVTSEKQRKQLLKVHNIQLSQEEKNRDWGQLVEIVSILVEEGVGRPMDIEPELAKRILLSSTKGIELIPNNAGMYYGGQTHFLLIEPDRVSEVLLAVGNHFRQFSMNWGDFDVVLRLTAYDMQLMLKALEIEHPNDVSTVFKIMSGSDDVPREWESEDYMRLFQYFPHIDDSDDSDLDPEGVPPTMLNEFFYFNNPQMKAPQDNLAVFASWYWDWNKFLKKQDDETRRKLEKVRDTNENQYAALLDMLGSLEGLPQGLTPNMVKTIEYLQKKYWSGGEPLLGEGILESRRNDWFDSPVIILIEFEDAKVEIEEYFPIMFDPTQNPLEKKVFEELSAIGVDYDYTGVKDHGQLTIHMTMEQGAAFLKRLGIRTFEDINKYGKNGFKSVNTVRPRSDDAYIIKTLVKMGNKPEELQEADDDTGGTFGQFAPQPEDDDDDATGTPAAKGPSFNRAQVSQDDLTRAGFYILNQPVIDNAVFHVMNKYTSEDFIRMLREDASISARIMNTIGNIMHGSQKEALLSLITQVQNGNMKELRPFQLNLIEHYMASVALEYAMHAFHQSWDHRIAYKKFKAAEKRYKESQDAQDREDMQIYERRAQKHLLEALLTHLEKYMMRPASSPAELSQRHITHHDTYKGKRLPDDIVYKLNESFNPPKRMPQDIIKKWKRLLD